MKYTLLAILLWIIASLAGYGVYELCTYSERLDLIESLQAENATLKNKVTWLRRTNAFSLILEQVLTKRQIDEAALLNEMAYRAMIKKYEGGH